MPSGYNRLNWNNNDPKNPLNAGNLNNIENGIYVAHEDATAALNLAFENATDITTNANSIVQVGIDSTAYTDVETTVRISGDINAINTAVSNANSYTDSELQAKIAQWIEFTPSGANSNTLDLSAEAGDNNVLVDTIAANVIVLPSSPIAGQKITIIDAAGDTSSSGWGTGLGFDTTITALGNIEANVVDVVIDDPIYTRIEFVWTNTLRGWAIFKIG